MAWFATGAALLALASAACSKAGLAATRGDAPGQTQLALTATDVTDPPGSDEPAQPAGAEAPSPSPFWTRYAYFVPSQFNDLPGWREDHLAEAWKAFRSSCNVLATRKPWASPCSRSSGVNARDDADIRRFFELEFSLYQIRNKDRSPAGVITGYYEPLLHGSRRYGDPYVYPVYGVPDDLLYLDSRVVPRVFFGETLFARIDGRAVIPVCTNPSASVPCEGPYTLDVGDAKPDIRDKKLRVRIEGRRIVPYYTRAQIEKGTLAMAQVIAWVDDRAALYSMQVQGSGKVHLPDGQVLRLAYAEQNGHPFNPPVQAARRGGPSGRASVLTRGIAIPLSDADDGLEPATAEVPGEPLLRGESAAPEVRRGADVGGGVAGNEAVSPEVARMVELLLKGNSAPQPVPPVASEHPPKERPGSEPRQTLATPAGATAKVPGGEGPSPFSSDPSYVFFRQIPDSDGGPLGALGVPLTPGRSVAVDPRTTPLGSPVFISTEGQSFGTQLNRLMLAQDTGGAIRGPVRADYFWGFGPNAGGIASRMKETGRMWLLLPKDLRIWTGTPGFGMRGVDVGASGDAECLVPDPDLCVE